MASSGGKAIHGVTRRDQLADSNPPVVSAGFCHSAVLYAEKDELLSSLERFVRDGLDADEPVLLALSQDKLAPLGRAFRNNEGAVQFADMDVVGANPARLIPIWRAFVDSRAPGQSCRGVGEPITAERAGAALAECQIHEALLNLAFADDPPFRLLCPYDTAALDAAVVEEARRSHPFIISDGHSTASVRYAGVENLSELPPDDLPPVPGRAHRYKADGDTLDRARRKLHARALALGLRGSAADDLVLAVHEAIANSVQYGGGVAAVAVWRDVDTVICEVRDRGPFDQPLAGRTSPAHDSTTGRGLWMANQLCDLVQIRSVNDGSVVRIHLRQRV